VKNLGALYLEYLEWLLRLYALALMDILRLLDSLLEELIDFMNSDRSNWAKTTIIDVLKKEVQLAQHMLDICMYVLRFAVETTAHTLLRLTYPAWALPNVVITTLAFAYSRSKYVALLVALVIILLSP